MVVFNAQTSWKYELALPTPKDTQTSHPREIQSMEGKDPKSLNKLFSTYFP